MSFTSRPWQLLTCVLLVSIVLPVQAQDRATTRFDFDSLAEGQTGAYEPADGAEVLEAAARSSLISGWPSRGHEVRLPLGVTSTGAATPQAVMDISVAILPPRFRDRLLTDGTDLSVQGSDGQVLDRLSLGVSTASARGLFLVRVPELAAGSSTFSLYAGDDSAASNPDERVFATSAEPTVRMFVSGGFNATDVRFVSMIDGNSLDLGAGPQAFDLLTPVDEVAIVAGNLVRSAGPMAAIWTGIGGDALAPESFAGMEFVIPSPRYDEELFVTAPFGDATLTFAAPSLADVAVASGTTMRISTLVADAQAIVMTSSVPVLVVRGSDSGDITPMPPSATELWGLGSSIGRVAAGAAGATVTVIRSDVSVTTLTLAAFEEVSIGGGGIQGSGTAMHLISDEPVGALTYGDGDGGEAVAFLPTNLLSREFVLPTGAQFIAISASLPNTECVLVQADGTELARASAGSSAPPTPGRIFMGSQTNGLRLAAPAALSCNHPVWALYEEASSDTEKLLIGAAAFRPHSGGQVTFDATGLLETRFAQGVGRVVTPSYTPPRPATEILAVSADARPALGGSLSWQVSLDDGPWMIPGDSGLVEAPSEVGAALSAFVGATFAAASALRFALLIETDGIADSQVDGLDLEVALVSGPTSLRFEGVSDQRVGQPFNVVLTTHDAAGAVLSRGTVNLIGEPSTVFGQSAIDLVAGRAEGAVTALTAGQNVVLVASFEGLAARSSAFNVLPAASELIEISGADQSGPGGEELPQALVVQVNEQSGAPAPNVPVLFEVTSGGGSVSAASVTTDAMGRAQVRWTLGTSGDQALWASVSDQSDLQVLFSATVSGGGGCSLRPGTSDDSASPFFALSMGLLGLIWWRRRG